MDWEREIGIGAYLTEYRCEGEIRRPEGFRVEEEGVLGRARIEKGWEEPRGEGKHLYVVLVKREWDHNKLLWKISKKLGIPLRSIGYAGVKDKRAVTAQWISLEGVRWEEVRDIDIRDVYFHSPVYREKKLRVGMLKGNWFRVDLDCDSPPGHFINYFGHQRFGSYRFVSHLVGRELLRGDTEKALHIYLTHTSRWEPEDTREARERFKKEGDPKEALAYFPRELRYERIILRGMVKGESPERVLKWLPRGLVSMFIHAYQSYLFNEITTRRSEYGYEPREGDILEEGIPTAPVPGYRNVLAGGIQGEIEAEVFDEEGLDITAFRKWKRYATHGGRRKMVEKARWEGGWFFLGKNTYATSYLRELLKPSSPFGFIL